MPPTLHIALDVRAASHTQAGGFKTYAEGLIAGLAELHTPHRFLLCADRLYAPPGGLPPNCQVAVVPGGPKLVGPGWREQVALPLQLARARVDAAHYLYNTSPVVAPGRRVVTIHDLILLRPPVAEAASLHRRLLNAYSRLLLLWSARSAHAIVTDSHYSAREIAERFPQAASRLHVVYPAAHALFRPADPNEAVSPAGRGYVLVLGSADPRKNVSMALAAYAALPPTVRQARGLVVTLAHAALRPALERQCAALGIAERTTFVERATLQELRGLYATAGVFLFPSLYEGFGLPPLEAMLCGTPVVSSNAASLPEVVAEAGLLVDPRDPQAMTEALRAVLTDEALAAQLRARGLRRAAEFAWAKTAQQAVAVYEQVCGAA